MFAAGERGRPAEPLYLHRHRIRSGVQTIRMVVSGKPARAGIDPWRKLIDRRGDDNVSRVVTGPQ